MGDLGDGTYRGRGFAKPPPRSQEEQRARGKTHPFVPCAPGFTQPLPFYCVFSLREKAERSSDHISSIIFGQAHEEVCLKRRPSLGMRHFLLFICWINPDLLHGRGASRAPLGRRRPRCGPDGIVLKGGREEAFVSARFSICISGSKK